METGMNMIAGVAVLRTLKHTDQRMRYADFCKVVGWTNVRKVGKLLDLIAIATPSLSRADMARVVGVDGKPGEGLYHHSRVVRFKSPGQKAARTRKRRAAARKAAATRKRNG